MSFDDGNIKVKISLDNNWRKIPYYNTTEGIHERAKELKMKAWTLGCSCDECNKEFNKELNDVIR